MNLHIEFPENLIVSSMLEQRDIPCLCRIGAGPHFEIAFQDPLPEATGRVEGWSSQLIDARAPAGGGGEYTHYCFARVTLEKTDECLYRIKDLSFFKHVNPGWFPIVKEGEWSEPVPRNTPEELAELEAFEAAFKLKRLSKKRQKLYDLLAKDSERNSEA